MTFCSVTKAIRFRPQLCALSRHISCYTINYFFDLICKSCWVKMKISRSIHQDGLLHEHFRLYVRLFLDHVESAYQHLVVAHVTATQKTCVCEEHPTSRSFSKRVEHQFSAGQDMQQNSTTARKFKQYLNRKAKNMFFKV